MSVRRILCTLTLLVGGPLVLTTTSASAASSERLGGQDRYETAALVAQKVYDEGLAGSTVLLTTGENFPDALSAGAWTDDAVVLLSRRESLPQVTRDFLANEWIERVLVVGGTSAVSAQVFTEVAQIVPDVERIWGEDRYATSVQVSRRANPDKSAKVIYVAPGSSFFEQLVAVAASRANDGAFLIAPPGRRGTVDFYAEIERLRENSETQVFIYDRNSVLNLGIANQEHISGDGYEMNNMSQPLTDELVVASGDNWPDALGGSRLITAQRSMILTPRLCASFPLFMRYLGDQRVLPANGASSQLILGGEMAVSEDAAAGLVCPNWQAIRSRYVDVALNCEYGSNCDQVVKRPAGAIAVEIVSDYRTDQGMAVVWAMWEWNKACPEIPMAPTHRIEIPNGYTEAYDWKNEAGMRMSVAFAPRENLSAYVDSYESGNDGFFSFRYSRPDFKIVTSRIAISETLSGSDLVHMVLEEMTQSLGLQNDVDDSSSIFNQSSGGPTEYSELDYEVIRVHCSKSVQRGMTSEDLPSVWARKREPLWPRVLPVG